MSTAGRRFVDRLEKTLRIIYTTLLIGSHTTSIHDEDQRAT